MATVIELLLQIGTPAGNEAEEVVRLLIFLLGGSCVGAAAVYGIWHVKAKQMRPLLTAMHLLGVIGLALLTGEHVLSHLKQGTAPVWQLWGALASFTLLASAFISMIRNRQITVTEREDCG